MAILGKLSELDKTMIWYTYKADLNVIQNQFVQLSSDGLTVELHTTGAAIGICMTLETTEDTQEHLAQVYVAGGSGQDAVLNASWNGAPSRFEVINADFGSPSPPKTHRIEFGTSDRNISGQDPSSTR